MKRNPFTNPDIGISGVVPDGWVQAQPGVWLRHASETDLNHLVQQRVGGLNSDEVMNLVVSQEGLEAFPEQVGMIESPNFTWSWYRGKASEPIPRVVDLALAQRENWMYFVVLGTTPEETDTLHEAVFLPAVHALAPADPDPEYARQLGAHAEEYRQMVRAGRAALRNGPWPEFPTQSDQEQGLPIPPPQQPYDASAPLISLPTPDPSILTKPDLFACVADRKSHRKYSSKSLNIQELSYLLWVTQGVRQVTMGGKGSLRTVPASGSRHPFETYLAVNRIQGIEPGVYRYLPFEHKLVHLFNCVNLAEKLGELSLGQAFVGQGRYALSGARFLIGKNGVTEPRRPRVSCWTPAMCARTSTWPASPLAAAPAQSQRTTRKTWIASLAWMAMTNWLSTLHRLEKWKPHSLISRQRSWCKHAGLSIFKEAGLFTPPL